MLQRTPLCGGCKVVTAPRGSYLEVREGSEVKLISGNLTERSVFCWKLKGVQQEC